MTINTKKQKIYKLLRNFSILIDTQLANSGTSNIATNGNTPMASTKVVSNGAPPPAPPPPPPPIMGNFNIMRAKGEFLTFNLIYYFVS